MSILEEFLPKCLIEIIKEYHIPISANDGMEVFNNYWRVDEDNLVFRCSNDRNWYYYNKDRSKRLRERHKYLLKYYL